MVVPDRGNDPSGTKRESLLDEDYAEYRVAQRNVNGIMSFHTRL